ncbi:hypothetical protein [Paraflavitalea pollutisoli]|uniref:hypothetical protein n=1 Tax=Paraflavitalea pollutisoli TaxID=3034143 RepID=UPI0023ED3366|nr:hypothetical protein [Paraflavitalea sp. H1-2-19X]
MDNDLAIWREKFMQLVGWHWGMPYIEYPDHFPKPTLHDNHQDQAPAEYVSINNTNWLTNEPEGAFWIDEQPDLLAMLSDSIRNGLVG